MRHGEPDGCSARVVWLERSERSVIQVSPYSLNPSAAGNNRIDLIAIPATELPLKGRLKSKGGSDERVIVLSLHQPSPSRNPPMRDRLTLKSTHQPDQAADPDDKPSRTPGRRQPQELQTAFLDGILNQMVTVYLVNGIRLTGQVRQHDQYTLQLQDVDGIDSLIFKHAISTIIPGAPVVTRERRTPFGKRPEWIG